MQGSTFRFGKVGRGFYLKLQMLANPALRNWWPKERELKKTQTEISLWYASFLLGGLLCLDSSDIKILQENKKKIQDRNLRLYLNVETAHSIMAACLAACVEAVSLKRALSARCSVLSVKWHCRERVSLNKIGVCRDVETLINTGILFVKNKC